MRLLKKPSSLRWPWTALWSRQAHEALLQQGGAFGNLECGWIMRITLLQQGSSAFAAAGDADKAITLLQQGSSSSAQLSGDIYHLTLLQQGGSLRHQ